MFCPLHPRSGRASHGPGSGTGNPRTRTRYARRSRAAEAMPPVIGVWEAGAPRPREAADTEGTGEKESTRRTARSGTGSPDRAAQRRATLWQKGGKRTTGAAAAPGSVAGDPERGKGPLPKCRPVAPAARFATESPKPRRRRKGRRMGHAPPKGPPPTREWPERGRSGAEAGTETHQGEGGRKPTRGRPNGGLEGEGSRFRYHSTTGAWTQPETLLSWPRNLHPRQAKAERKKPPRARAAARCGISF